MDVRKKSSQKVSKKTHCFDVKANKYNTFYAQNQIMEEYRKKKYSKWENSASNSEVVLECKKIHIWK